MFYQIRQLSSSKSFVPINFRLRIMMHLIYGVDLKQVLSIWVKSQGHKICQGPEKNLKCGESYETHRKLKITISIFLLYVKGQVQHSCQGLQKIKQNS